MQNKYGLTQEEIELSELMAKQIVAAIHAKGLDFNKTLERMRKANNTLEAKVNHSKRTKVA